MEREIIFGNGKDFFQSTGMAEGSLPLPSAAPSRWQHVIAYSPCLGQLCASGERHKPLLPLHNPTKNIPCLLAVAGKEPCVLSIQARAVLRNKAPFEIPLLRFEAVPAGISGRFPALPVQESVGWDRPATQIMPGSGARRASRT